jgi:hypothetical protein
MEHLDGEALAHDGGRDHEPMALEDMDTRMPGPNTAPRRRLWALLQHTTQEDLRVGVIADALATLVGEGDPTVDLIEAVRRVRLRPRPKRSSVRSTPPPPPDPPSERERVAVVLEQLSRVLCALAEVKHVKDDELIALCARSRRLLEETRRLYVASLRGRRGAYWLGRVEKAINAEVSLLRRLAFEGDGR